MKTNIKALTRIWLAALLCLPWTVSTALAADIASLVNTAGMQRMLSQRITKDYLFLGHEIRGNKARRQLKGSVALMVNNQAALKKSVTDPEVLNLLAEIDPLLEQMVTIAKVPYVKASGATMLELSDALLKLNQAVVAALEDGQAKKIITTVDLAGRQRMLSQRMAMFYAADQAGFNSEATTTQMKRAIETFESAHAMLRNDALNSDKINRELRGVENLWKTIRPYFTEGSTQAYPVTIFATTDDIMKRMNGITLLYVKAHWAATSKQ